MAERDPIELHSGEHQEIDVAQIMPATAKAPNRRRRKVLLALVAAQIVIGGGWYMLSDGNHVSTDNAYVNADSAQVTPLVSAAVKSVEVVNTQWVRKGEVLLRLDDNDAQLALEKAEADYLKARRQFAQ